MSMRVVVIAVFLCFGGALCFGQEPGSGPASRLTLREAVDLALKHNHIVRISEDAVDEKQYARDVAKSSYLPVIHNGSSFLHVTDTEFIGIPAGAFGTSDGASLPSRPIILNQGGKDFTISGTTLVQPITQLFKVRSENNVARADLNATRDKSKQAQNEVALKVHQLYYQILIVESSRGAIEAKIRASDQLQSERLQQVKYGSALQADLIESRAQSLQAKQELISADVQLSDLRMQFNDVIGFPLNAAIELDPDVPERSDSCQRQECLKLALEANPEVSEARAEVEKAQAAVQLAKRDYIPDVEAFANYTYDNNVPFLARNAGTFGVRLSYDVFDGGKKRSTIREREAQLAEAKENLASVSDEVGVQVQAAYNNLDRAQQMVAVSKELVALRQEARSEATQQADHGELLQSQAQSTVAQEFEARTSLLQSQLEYDQAYDELLKAVGQVP